MEHLIEWGYWGLFIGSFLASTILPLSADAQLIALIALGGNAWICLVVATIGNWLGGLTSYWIGWIGKWAWIERWFKIKEEKIIRQKERVKKYGTLLALLTWLPIVGDLLAIALGFYKISPRLCAFYMLIGRFARFFLWIILYLQYKDIFTAWFQG